MPETLQESLLDTSMYVSGNPWWHIIPLDNDRVLADDLELKVMAYEKKLSSIVNFLQSSIGVRNRMIKRVCHLRIISRWPTCTYACIYEDTLMSKTHVLTSIKPMLRGNQEHKGSWCKAKTIWSDESTIKDYYTMVASKIWPLEAKDFTLSCGRAKSVQILIQSIPTPFANRAGSMDSNQRDWW